MSSARLAAAACAGLVALSACGQPVAPEFAPAPERMTPRGGPAARATTASIAGRFYLTATERVAGDGVWVDLGFRAALDGVALEGVTWVSQGELRAQVPAGLAPGPHALTVTSPAGSAGTLPAAWLTSEQAPAQLVLSARLPAVVSAGQEFTAGFTASNPGGVDASEVTLQLTTSGPAAARITSLPVSRTVPAGGSESLPARLVAAAPGALDWSATAAGTDVVSGLALAGSATGTLLVESAPALTAAPGPAPAAVSVGQAFELAVEVTNSGGAGVLGLALAEPLAAGPGALKLTSLPAPQDLPGGASRTFRFGYLAEAAGAATLSVEGQGQDANGAGAVPLPRARWGSVLVQAPAALSAALAAPAAVSVGQTASVTLTLRNTGGAGALSAAPGLLSLTPAGVAAVASGSSPASAALAPGASQDFTWSFTALASGVAAFSVDAHALDANSGQTVTVAPATATSAVQRRAALALASSTSSAVVEVGQALTFSLTATNNGEAAALAVAPTLSLQDIAGSGTALVASGPAPASAAIAGGQSQTFTWRLQGASAGAFVAKGSVSGTDENDGAGVTAGPAAAPKVTVQTAPALGATASLSRGQVSVGQQFSVSLQLLNSGGTTAAGLQPALGACAAASVLASPASQDAAGGASVTFTWALLATAAGSCSFTCSAAGADANTGAALQASAVTGALTSQSPAALAATLSLAQAAVNLSQPVLVSLVVTNSGDAAATGVVPQLTLSPGAAAAKTAPSPASATIAGHSSQTFTWTVTPSATGALSLTGSAAGADANSGAAVAAPTASASLTVQPAAALAGSLAVPSQVSNGQPFTVSYTVSNSGGAAANSVAPSTLAVTGSAGGAATLVSGPAPAAATVVGGGSVTFSWTVQATSKGTVTFQASATGTDANSGSAVGAAVASGSTQVGAVTLAGGVTWSQDTISVGQTVTVTLTITNSGTSQAKDVLPGAPVLSGSATLVPVGGGPGTADIGPGQSQTFTFTYTATGAGTVTISVGAAGTDKNTGLAVTMPPATSPTLTVQTPPALSAALAVTPAVNDVGDVFTVTLTVSNAGQATAAQVAPAGFGATPGAAVLKLGGPTPPQQGIPGLSSKTLVWTYQALQAGTVTFTAGAAGKDTNSNLSVSAAATTATVLLQTPASLSAALPAPAGPLDSGDPLTLLLKVTNSGDTEASGVAPSALTVSSGSATCPGSPTPASATAPGHGSISFTWSCTAATAGSVTFTAGASGTDAVNGAAVTAASATSASLLVQAPAALSATLSLPSAVGVGSTFTAALAVTNTGGVAANAVSPAPPVASGANTGAASGPTGPTPAGPVTLAAGASQTFTWTYAATSAGSYSLTTSASGTDANNGAARSASAAAATTLNAAVVQVLNPSFSGSESTTFSSLFSYQNQIWLGPSGDGSNAVHANPDGSAPLTANWQFELDTASGYTATNSAYQGGSPPACLTIGYTGCAQNSTACGPDNEGGRGLFFSGTIGGTEWLFVSGSRAGLNNTHFLYLTNPTLPLVNGRLDFLYLNLKNTVGGATNAVSSALVNNGRLYLGMSDTGGGAPLLNEVRNLPAAVPGLNANAVATDAVNLQARYMPYLGVSGANPNPLLLTPGATVLLDTVATFGVSPGDALYVANNGGWLRSKVSVPAACTSGGCADWVVTTPSAPAYAAKTSLTVSPFNKNRDFEPADKAVPAIVPFGGRLFAARNTTAGPQLWSCNPTGNTSAGPANTQCNPGDWTLVAANSSSTAPFPDGNLTQMQNPNNTAITLLAAAGGYLYVGYNNATDGLELYRTANPGVSNRSEFVGSGNCNNGTLPCEGLGGKGLGAGVTRIFDSRALTFSGAAYLYLAAGTGSGAVSVYRVTP